MSVTCVCWLPLEGRLFGCVQDRHRWGRGAVAEALRPCQCGGHGMRAQPTTSPPIRSPAQPPPSVCSAPTLFQVPRGASGPVIVPCPPLGPLPITWPQVIIGGMVILFAVAFCISAKFDKGREAELQELHRTHIIMCASSLPAHIPCPTPTPHPHPTPSRNAHLMTVRPHFWGAAVPGTVSSSTA
jgi:hypothetical protein